MRISLEIALRGLLASLSTKSTGLDLLMSKIGATNSRVITFWENKR
jgi:hypothetical protein